MKYLLINQETGAETLCEKVTIDEFDYYVCGDLPSIGDKSILDEENFGPLILIHHIKCEIGYEGRKIIASNNHYLNIPQVVDEAKVIKLAFKHIACTKDSQFDRGVFHGFVGGYNKSQETHPFSYEDADAYADAVMGGCLLRAKEWKSQQPQKIYYTQTTQP